MVFVTIHISSMNSHDDSDRPSTFTCNSNMYVFHFVSQLIRNFRPSLGKEELRRLILAELPAEQKKQSFEVSPRACRLSLAQES